jgi:hypothetical protein
MDKQRPTVDHGDEIFYNHPDHGLRSGRVIAVGEHGVQVDDPAGPVRVLHEHIVGHKARAKRQLTLVEEGEDGYLAKDELGRTVYVNGKVPEQQMAKSLQDPVLSQPEIDIALMRAGFVPSVEYIQKSYGAHWGLPASPTLLVDEVRAQVLEVARSNAEVAQSLLAAVRELGSKLEGK